jgi:hypothetical protein
MCGRTEFWPGVLADFGPPSVPQPTVTLVLPRDAEWIGTPEWNCSSSCVRSMSLVSARSPAWRPSSACIVGWAPGNRRCDAAGASHWVLKGRAVRQGRDRADGHPQELRRKQLHNKSSVLSQAGGLRWILDRSRTVRERRALNEANRLLPMHRHGRHSLKNWA